MANSDAERFNDPEATLRIAMAGALAGVWTSLPGIIESYDATTQTANVTPAVQGQVVAPDGTVTLVNLPVVPDVPVYFPGGGGVTLTFPVKAGDECWLVFAARGIDAWHAQGGIQPPTAGRRHALADAACYVGMRSQPRRLATVSTTAAVLRTDDGLTTVEVGPGLPIKAVAPNGFNVIGNVNVTGTITASVDVVTGTISLKNHRTSGVTTGGGTSGPPVP